MTLLPMRRTDAGDATLVRRARRGDRRARRLLVRRHAPRAVELAGVLVDAPASSSSLAASVLDAAIAAGTVDDDGLVRCAVHVLAAAAGEAGLARLAVMLSDVDGRTDDTVADLIGRTTEEVAQLRASARDDLGVAQSAGRQCRGWALAARRDRLTVSEQEAAHGHLLLCRSCRVRLDEQRRTRDKLRLSGTAVSAVVVADVVSLAVPATGAVVGANGMASLVLGKAGVALIGGAAVAIVGTSTGLAVARHNAPSPGSDPTVVREVTTHLPASPSPRVAAPNDVRATESGETPTGATPAPATTAATRPAPALSPLPARSLLPSVAPLLPTSLPTSLPLPVPSVTVVVPLPTVVVTPALPVPLPTDVLNSTTSLLGR